MTRRSLIVAATIVLLGVGVGVGAGATQAQGTYPATASFTAFDSPDLWLAADGTNVATISLGGTVDFTSATGEPHDASFGSSPVVCNVGSGPIGPRLPLTPSTTWSGSCAFQQPGNFPFVCTVHAGMGGEVRVAQADGTLPTPGGGPGTGAPGAPSDPGLPGVTAPPGAPAGPLPGIGTPVASAALRPVFEFARTQQGAVVRGTVANAGAGATATIDVSARRRDLSATQRSSASVRLRRVVRTTDATGSTTFAITLNAQARRALIRRKRLPLSVRVTVTGPRIAAGTVRRTQAITLVRRATAPATARVAVRNNFFTPRNQTVRKGGKITWAWQSEDRPHDVSGPGFKTPIKSGGTFSRTFARAGMIKYVCTLHDGMEGTITVR